MEVVLHEEICCECRVSFWITEEHHNKLLKCKNTFYCPNGHPQHYLGETDKQKLERYKQYLKNTENSKDMLRRSNSALRGVITRMKNKQEQ